MIVVGVVALLVLLSSLNTFSSESSNLGESEYIHQKEEYWTGIPLSPNNPLYHDPTTDWDDFNLAKEEMREELRNFSNSQWKEDDESFRRMLDKYRPRLGWNGMFDAMDDYHRVDGFDYPSARMHWFGEQIYLDSDTAKHAVELTTRDILHKAPMHGAVWSAIEEFGVDDLDALFSLVYDDLCNFRNVPGMGKIWISCAHGVGHGVSMLFPPSQVDLAIDVCAQVDDGQFQYACATGVYMNLELNRDSFWPCDTSRFPGACFRFHIKRFADLQQGNVTDMCSTQCDPYHKMGCIYGRYYVLRDLEKNQCQMYLPSSPEDEPQASYHAACVEGVYSSHPHGLGKFGDIFCHSFKNLPKSYEICEKYNKLDFENLSFDNEEEYYNAKLLESLYDPLASTCHSADPIFIPDRE